MAASLRGGASDVLFWLRTSVWSRIYDGFDRQHGTDTRGIIPLEQLGLRHPSARFGVRYQAIDARVFRQALRSLPSEVSKRDFTFIDLGCGKGRALVLARECGFKEVVGVELSAILSNCARANLKIANITNARVVCQDVSEFQFPLGNLLLFLFNPFVGEVFRKTIQNLCASVSGDVYLVYINPVEEPLLCERPCFVRSHYDARFVIYHHAPHARPALPPRFSLSPQ